MLLEAKKTPTVALRRRAIFLQGRDYHKLYLFVKPFI